MVDEKSLQTLFILELLNNLPLSETGFFFFIFPSVSLTQTF